MQESGGESTLIQTLGDRLNCPEFANIRPLAAGIV